MTWENTKVENLRFQLIKEYTQGNSNISRLCAHYKVSRKTAYKWLQRYLDQGFEGLKDQSRAPKQPNRKYSEEILEKAIDEKTSHMRWGPKKILVRLKKKYPTQTFPSQSRLSKFFKAHNLVKPRRNRRKVPKTSPLGELNGSNDVWMVDFKGWFLTKNREKCEPLTITDGFSRYLIRCVNLPRKNAEFVWQIFEEAFQEFGLPKRIRSDNGPPFGCTGAGRLTKLSVYLIKAGVTPEWINPGCPQENGRHERFHLTLKQEIASPPAANLKAQLRLMQEFQESYNYERPHEALEMETPASCYISSSRKWDGKLCSPKYEKSVEVRKVGQSGSIWLDGKEYYISTALVGEPVGLIQVDTEHKVYYGPIFLGVIKRDKFSKPKRRLKKNEWGRCPQSPGKNAQTAANLPFSELD